MNYFSAIFLIFLVAKASAADCPAKKTASKLICYYSKIAHVDSCKCSHVVLPADSDVKNIERIRERIKGVKILITVNEFNQGLVNILKSSKVDGIEINLKKLDSKNDISDFISTVRSKLGSGLYVVLSVPAKTETLAKYYDFKSLSKNADLFILQTAFLGASKNVTFHPSRLSGLWDMQNTDSVVDLVSGLGAPLSKLVIASPVQAFKFQLQSEKHTAPGSPALEIQSITRDELCNIMGNGGNWTLERDQDQAGPYIFSENQWIAFDDPTSIDIKAKYARVRGLAGMALKDLSQDGGTKCKSSILDAAYNGLSRQARAPRGAVLHSLEREILETPARPLDSVQVSPYRISRVIDVEGNVHVIRKDTRTEFECSRQGYFVHPRSCGRFYRCVKFDQLSDEFSVFEFDCPAGLAFDNRVEVCVWPGSLSHASACSGSSEIAPVPRERFICPGEPGYYADPENCRWFFACLDHGKSPLSAYEFRCPFGLVYDESRLLCEWPWLVPKCGSGYAVGSTVVYGGAGSVALEQYDGLGKLEVTALGGLHGPLQKTEAQIYSNVGLVSKGNVYATDNGQLSLQAAHSLQNAGLLKNEYVGGADINGAGAGYIAGAGYTAGAGDGNSGIKSTQVHGSGLIYAQGQQDSSLNGIGHGSGFGVRLQQVGVAYQGDGYAQNTGASLVNAGNAASEYQTNYVDHGTNLNFQTGSLLTGTSQSSGETAIGGTYSGGTYEGNTNAHLVNGLVDGFQATAVGGGEKQATIVDYNGAKSTIEYHGNAGSNYGSGTRGNINIVGGGYSAVGVAGNGVHVTNYGEDSNIVAHVTQSPVSVATVSSIPTVTSVPVPALNVASGFQSYGGGVVANVPELQYKVNGNIAASRGSSGFANFSNGFVSVVSSTPSTIIAKDGYHYDRPTVAFIEEPIKSTVSTDTGYVQHNVANVQPVVNTYEKPVFVSTTQTPLVLEQANIQPAVSTYQKPISTSFVQHVTNVQPVVNSYEEPEQVPILDERINVQPVVTTYQKPVIVSTTQSPVVVENINIQPVVSTYNVHKQGTSFAGYNYPKPTIKFEETPVKATGGSFSYENVDLIHKSGGYSYPKPAVAFEEIPTKTINQAVVTTYSTPSTIKPLISVQHVQPVVQVQPTVHTVVEPVIKQQPVVAVTRQEIVQPKLQVTSYNVPSSTIRPIVFEQPQVYVSSTPATIPLVKQQEAVSFTNFQRHEIVQPQLQVTSYNVPTQTDKPVVVEQSPQIYVSSTPATVVQPIVKEHAAVSFTNFQRHETVQPQIDIVNYNTPSTNKPIAPVIQQKVVQPAIVSSFSISSNNEGYKYDRPSIAFEERPQVLTYQQPAVQKTNVAVQPVISTYNYQAPIQVKQPKIVTYQQPVVSTYNYQTPVQVKQPQIINYQQPAVSTYNYEAPIQVKPAISTYNYKNVLQSTVSQGYDYPKPAIGSFEEVPASVTRLRYDQKPAVVSSYSYVAPSTVKPAVVVQKQTPVVTNYAYTPSTVKQAVLVQQPAVSTYVQSTPKTAIFLQKQPAVVSSYSYVAPSTVRPAVTVEPTITYTQRPIVPKKQPAVVTSYSFRAQPVQPVAFAGYDYPKPSVSYEEEPIPVVTSYENRQPVQEEPFVAKKAYVTGGQSSSYQYTQQFDTDNFEQKPQVVENYQAPIQQVVSTTPQYEYRQPVVVSTTPRYEYKQQYSVDSGYVYDKPEVTFEEKPVVVQNYKVPVAPKPIIGSYYIENTPQVELQKVVTSTSRPIVDYTYVQSTPKPTFTSTIKTIVSGRQPFRYYDSRLVSTERPISYSTSVPVAETLSTSRPISRYSYNSFDDGYEDVKLVNDYVVPIRVSTPAQFKVASVATSRPIVKYSFSSLDSQYQDNRGKVVENYVAPIEVTTPVRDYLPVAVTTSIPTESYVAPVQVTTSAPEPSREYLPVRTRVKVTTTSTPEISTPSREYLPVKSRVRVTTSPSNSYLPVEPVRVVRPKTIVKVNDFHPLLSAKLGAQCTCVSNAVKLRKKPLKIVLDDDDDDGYVVDNNDQGVVVENYQFEPQKTVEITPTPEVYIKSTTSEYIEPSPTPVYIRKRVRVRPATSTVAYESPVTQAAELFVRKSVTPVDTSSDAVVVNALSNDLDSRGDYRERVSSNRFDRYGPGGLRSRDEKLQGTIDCQRAGLFRHPTQCNKFYACRWDCTKNRYTLHVFNCPVHLTFDNNLGACNWPSQGPACLENTLLPSD